MDCIVHPILLARILEWEPFPTPGDLPNSGIEPRSPALQEDSLTAELQGKLKNTEMGSLSLLQQIFPIQEIKPGSPALQADFFTNWVIKEAWNQLKT